MGAYRIVGLCGSLRAGSYNRMLMRLAEKCMPAGTSLEPMEIGDVPHFDGDVYSRGLPDAVATLCERIRSANGVLIVSPEYNFSIPGVLKNALDWLSRGEDAPLTHKPVALMSASPGPLGGARLQYDLRKVLLCMNAQVLAKPEIFVGNAGTKFLFDGECSDEVTQRLVTDQLKAFKRWIRAVERMKLGVDE